MVISTLDRPELLSRCLAALLSGSVLPAEIVVVDQGDPRAVDEVLERHRPAGVPLVHVVQGRRGLSASQNAGVARASGRAVSIVDDDCVPDARWVEVAAAEHAGSSRPLLVAGRVLPLPAEGDRTEPLSSRTSTVRRVLPADALPWEVGTGGNFSVDRAAYLRVGGNDERLGTGTPGRAGNDIDLFRRLLLAGVEARYEPDLLVLHERATAADRRSRRWSYVFGLGACVGVWLAGRDLSALRVLVAWLRLRSRRVRDDVGCAPDEARVLLGTVHGLLYGLSLGPRGGARGVGRQAARFGRLLRRPPVLLERVDQRLPVPLGRIGEATALRHVLRGTTGDAVVIGERRAAVRAVRRTPGLVLSGVVGTDPHDTAVTVVSEASSPDSLPHEKWDVVIVTDPGREVPGRLAAATSACRRGGLLAVRTSGVAQPVEDWLAAGDVRRLAGRRALAGRWLLVRRE